MSKLLHWNSNWKLQIYSAMNFLKKILWYYTSWPLTDLMICFPCTTNDQPFWKCLYCICEELFSKMNIMKNPYRNQLKVERKVMCLCVRTSQISRDTNISVTNIQCKFSLEVLSYLSNGEQWINKNKQNVIFMCPQFNLLRFHYKTDTSTKLIRQDYIQILNNWLKFKKRLTSNNFSTPTPGLLMTAYYH
jgi:plasmid replication initiation protein